MYFQVTRNTNEDRISNKAKQSPTRQGTASNSSDVDIHAIRQPGNRECTYRRSFSACTEPVFNPKTGLPISSSPVGVCCDVLLAVRCCCLCGVVPCTALHCSPLISLTNLWWHSWLLHFFPMVFIRHPWEDQQTSYMKTQQTFQSTFEVGNASW